MPNFRKQARPRMPAFALQLQGLEERLPHLLENGCASIARNLARFVAFAPLACTAGSWHWLNSEGHAAQALRVFEDLIPPCVAATERFLGFVRRYFCRLREI